MAELLFSKHDLYSVLQNQTEKLRTEVNNLGEDYILNASETDLVASLVAKYELHPPQLGEPEATEPKDIDVDVSGDYRYDFPSYSRSTMVRGYRVEIHVPFSGESDLFFCQPSTRTYSPPRADIEDGQILFVYQRPGVMNGQEVRSVFDQALGQIREYLQWIEADCSNYNSGLQNQVQQLVSFRKDRILKNRQAVTNIGLSIKRKEGSPKTFSVPNVRRKAEVRMPVVKDKGFIPEPTLPDAEYEHIISVMQNMVKVMERSPHSFATMKEEDIRSHFLVQLNGQYEGRATGETFNYEGKTDILIREGDRNVFIAECKFWTGEAGLLKTVGQILGYLHWRDTKAALVVFNRQKSFTEVLKKIEPSILSHACCKKLLRKVSDTEWRFLFGNKDDPNRELQLAVLLFDVPQATP